MEQRPTETAILVVNWRSADDVVRLLERIRPVPRRLTQVVVLDNNSGEEQIERIRWWAATNDVELGGRAGCGWPGAMTLIPLDWNVGYARGMNRLVGIVLEGACVPSRLLFLNPDALPSWREIEELEVVADESGAAVVGARVVSRDVVASGFAGERWPQILVAAVPGIGRIRSGSGRRWWPSGRFDGAAALFDGRFVYERWHRLGYFIDPALEMYWDEWDISRDAARQGKQVVTAGGAVIEHDQSALAESTTRRQLRAYYMARNVFVVANRWLPRPAYLALIVPMAVNALAVEVARSLVRRRRPPLAAALEGVADGVRQRTGRWRRHPD